jgi:DNA-binding GntR family transcriptional regulator
MSDSASSTLKDKAYEVIRRKIVTCELMPGSVVDQKLLMAEIGVSRTPVREAISALEREDLLVVMPRRGVIVAPISVGDISQIYTVREAVEPLIVRLAAPEMEKDKLQRFLRTFTREKFNPDAIIQADFLMHTYFSERTGNKHLIRLMAGVLSQNMRIVVLGARIQDRLAASNREHTQIIQKLLDGDSVGAEAAMRKHIASARTVAGMVNRIQL